MKRSEIFRGLHSNAGHPLLLPNVWDAGGARLVEWLGAKAVATTSAGVAWSMGYPDGNRLPVEQLVHLARSIVGAVRVPVTVDVEAGYADDPTAAGKLLAPVFEAGVAGINIEDGGDAPELLARKVEVIRRDTAARGLDLFVNARTDVYLRGLAPQDERAAETLRRARIYAAAGADGLFVPGLVEPAEIAEVTEGTRLPLNVMCFPGLPALAELARLNVRRLSAGSAISQVVWQQVAHLSRRFLAEGDSQVFAGESMAYGELQALFGNTRQAGT